jgi:phenylalanyl-tRNA synthetase beta chain
MPIVAINVDTLNELLGQGYEMDRLVEALEQLGCDVEDTSLVALYQCSACQSLNEKLDREEPAKKCTFCGYESEEYFQKITSHRVIRIDLLADRPDLFDAGGLSRALKGYLGIEKGLPHYSVTHNETVEVKVDPAVVNIRPYIACAMVTMPPLDNESLRELMRLQENLHWGISRDRKLSSIGIYDMEVIAPPIIFTAFAPDKLTFHPLGMPDKLLTLGQIADEHPKGIAYQHLIRGFEKYPILIDSKGLVLSQPPLINSDETKCKLGSTRLFVDVTGITSDAVTNSLNTLVCALSDLGGKIQSLKIHYPDRTIVTPDLTPRHISITSEDTSRWLGLTFTHDELIDHLQTMRLNGKLINHTTYYVQYPAYRIDILHPVDIYEDIAIANGFQNIETALVPTMTVGKEREEEKISTMVRHIMTGLGFTEIMSLMLQSFERHFTKFTIENTDTCVIVENPKTIDQKIARIHLMTGIMEAFNKNRRKSVPQHIFEIGNVIVLNPARESGVSEYRNLALAIIGPEAGYAEARANIDSVVREIGFKAQYTPFTHPSFIEGRCAQIIYGNNLKGLIGEVHPEVINNFNLSYPVAYCEIELCEVI